MSQSRDDGVRTDTPVVIPCAAVRELGAMPESKRKAPFNNHIRRKGYVHECESYDSNVMIGEHPFDEERVYKALAKFFCSCGVPPSAVELESFKEYVRLVNPQLYVESAIVEQYCLELYKEEKALFKEYLRSCDGQISLSMDILEAYKYKIYDCANDGPAIYNYLCVKAHFIDADWKLKTYVLGISPAITGSPDTLPESIILKHLSDWEIEDKISSLISVSAMMDLDDSAVSVRNKLQDKRTLPLDGRLFQISSCADILCSMVQVAYEKIAYTIRQINYLILPIKDAAYWTVTLHRLQTALQLEAEGEYLKAHYDKNDVPSADEWEKVRGVCKIVQLVYDAAEVLFETKHEGAGSYLHNLQVLRASLMQEATNSPDSFIRSISKRMLKRFSKYWQNIFLVLSVITVMDPRYKMKYIEFCSSKYDNTESGTSQVPTVLKAIHTLYDGYVTRNTEEEYPLSDSDSDSEEEEEFDEDVKVRRQNPNFGFDCLDEYNNFIGVNTMHQEAKSELECYLEEPVLPWRKNFSVLSWWRAASPKYPTLSKMARDLLATQLSLVADVEAYYTKMREPDHVGLQPEMLNVLTCCKSWSNTK